MRFTKMHGAGNDYVYVDCTKDPVPDDLPGLARRVSHRRYGIGGDGLILIRTSKTAAVRMQMFNADGTESGMCGNGVRCVAKYAHDHLEAGTAFDVETGSGPVKAEILGPELVRVDMGAPGITAPEVPTTLENIVDSPLLVDGETVSVTCASLGNPHCVLFVDAATNELVHGLGPKIETHPAFPERTNVEFVEVISRNEVKQRTWERGSGETWACGSGACAVAVAGVLTNRTDRAVDIHLVGGDLHLEWRESDGHVYMTGPAVEVFSGVL